MGISGELKVVASKNKRKRKPHAVFPVAVSPESLFPRFFGFTSLSLKTVAQPLLRGTVPSHLTAAQHLLQLVLEVPPSVVHLCVHLG